MKISTIYAKIRTGRAFFIFLAGGSAAWMLWNSLAPRDLRFDEPGFPLLTLMLSVEASLAASAIIVAGRDAEMKQEEDATLQRQQLRYLLDISKAILTLIESGGYKG